MTLRMCRSVFSSYMREVYRTSALLDALFVHTQRESEYLYADCTARNVLHWPLSYCCRQYYINSSISTIMSRRYDTLSAEENRCLPLRATRPAVLFLGSGEPAIPEPRGVDKPKHPTIKFIVAYMQLYVGEVFADAQMDKYLGNRGQSSMNAVFRDVIYGLYTLKNGDIRKLSYRDWTHMIRNTEATFGELRCFDGSWAARWMITRTWSSRKRNQQHRNQGGLTPIHHPILLTGGSIHR